MKTPKNKIIMKEKIPQIIDYLKENLKPSRFTHTMGVREEAVKLARKYGADIEKAEIAALVHDCCKNKTDSELICLADTLGVKLDKFQLANGKLLHAPVGAAFAKKYFGIEDSEIIDAVTYHTTGRADMTLLDKIIYLADYIDPNRDDFEGLATLRTLTYENLDKAMLYALELSEEHVRSKGAPLHPDTVSAIAYFKKSI